LENVASTTRPSLLPQTTTTYTHSLPSSHTNKAIACFFWAAALLGAEAGTQRLRSWWAARGAGASSSTRRRSTRSTTAAASSTPPRPPPSAYWRAGASNALGPALGYLALANISYPAQVLAKSAKVLPVMVAGTLLGGTSYSPFEYGCAAAIGGGVGLFALASSSGKKGGGGHGEHATGDSLAAPNAPLGYLLCFLNLALDGYTNAAQDAINRAWPGGATALWTMAWMNAWCGAYHGAYLAVTGAGRRLVAFCSAHPAAAADVALFCGCGAAGQLFIFFLIRRFGSTTNALVTTTRKFFNILLSVAWLGHPLNRGQWAGVASVFGGLLASAVAKGGKKKTHGQQHKKQAGGGGRGSARRVKAA
jgi:solute carrier family 35 (UDP-galactose transporter), member B1